MEKSVKCPFCQAGDNCVVDSRDTEEGSAIRRRRECLSCKRRFTTYERLEEMTIMVVKKDGTRQSFERSKLVAGITRACEKRPVAVSQIDTAVSRIICAINELGEKEVKAKWIGERAMESLRGIDDVAYVRFASVYRQFRDVNEFAKELTKLFESSK